MLVPLRRITDVRVEKIMSVDHDPSLADLRRSSENTRAAFAGSVNELRAKLNDTVTDFKARIAPANIKEEVQDHIRAGGQEFVASLKRKASANPLQTLAVGAGLAYPLWKMIRNIPAPIVLMGAGFWLAHQKSNGSVEENLTASAKEQSSNFASAIRDAAHHGAESMSGTAGDLTAAIGVQSLAEKATGATHDIAAAAADIGQTLAEKVSGVTESAAHAASEINDRAVALSRKSGNAALDFVQQNPLLVAGAGLVIGAFVANSIPTSESENRLFGRSSDDLKNEAKRSVAAGVDQAKKIASDVVSDVAAAAAVQGLSAEGVADAVEGLSAGVKAVTDKGLHALDRTKAEQFDK